MPKWGWIMSAPVNDEETSKHPQMHAARKLQEPPRMPAAAPSPRVNSPPMSPSHSKMQAEWRGGSSAPSSGRGLDNETRRRLYEPEPVHQPQAQRRGYSLLTLFSGFAIIASCLAVVIMIVAATTRPLWQGSGAQRDAASEAPQASSPSSAIAVDKRAGAAVTTIAAASGQQQSVAASVKQSRLAVPEENASDVAVRGVTENEIRFGISAPFSGAAKELGQNMKLGVETAFNVANTNGGVHKRQLRLIAVDDSYEPARTAETMKQLYEKDRVFGIVGNVGTPTAVVALPYALERRMLFYGAFTGAGLLRRNPPDRYVFNYRASYAEETDAVVRYLVKVRRIKPEQIAVFAQQDSYGDAGFAGVTKAVRSLPGGDESTILRLNYRRNTVDVDDAVAQLKKSRVPIRAVIMVPTYRAAARFIEKTRDLYPGMIYTSVSFVGSTALANELMLLGQKYATGVIVTQVVPAVDGHSSVVLDYKSALAKYFPGESPDYVSLEGYLAGSVLVEALKRNGPQLDTEKLVDTLENLRDFDLGLGTPVTFGRTEHQALHRVWGTELDSTGHYQAIDLQ